MNKYIFFKTIRFLLSLLKPIQFSIIIFEHKIKRKYSNNAIIQRVNSKNIEDALVYDTSTKIELFKNFLKKGDWGYYAYLGEEFVHRIWVKFGPQTIYLVRRFVCPLHLQDKEAYIHYC